MPLHYKAVNKIIFDHRSIHTGGDIFFWMHRTDEYIVFSKISFNVLSFKSICKPVQVLFASEAMWIELITPCVKYIKYVI